MGSFNIWGIVVRMRMGDDVKGVRYSLPDKVLLGCGTVSVPASKFDIGLVHLGHMFKRK